MKLAVFSAKPYDKKYLSAAREAKFGGSDDRDAADGTVQIEYHDFALGPETAALVKGAEAICIFVNDAAPAVVLKALHGAGVRAVLLRCAGYNNVDLAAAESLGLFVANVPAYSPQAVAEFAACLVQTVNRRPHRAYNRVREGNFSLEGLMGRTLYGRTCGIVGTGRIGMCMARIMKGFGMELLAYDPYRVPAFEEELGGQYVELGELLERSDVVSLHCPLFDKTHHVINADTLAKMKRGAILVNTSRGGLVDTVAAIDALKTGRLGGLGMDVYEGEQGLFYDDHSGDIIQDDVLMRLITFPNVVVCGHQAFFTEEALREIAECTMRNLGDFAAGKACDNSLLAESKTLQRRGTRPVRTV